MAPLRSMISSPTQQGTYMFHSKVLTFNQVSLHDDNISGLPVYVIVVSTKYCYCRTTRSIISATRYCLFIKVFQYSYLMPTYCYLRMQNNAKEKKDFNQFQFGSKRFISFIDCIGVGTQWLQATCRRFFELPIGASRRPKQTYMLSIILGVKNIQVVSCHQGVIII